MAVSEEMKKEIEFLFKRERWQSYVVGLTEGALGALYSVDISKERRVELLCRVVGVGEDLAAEYIEDWEKGIWTKEDWKKRIRTEVNSL